MPTPVQLSKPELTINGDEAVVSTNLTGIEPAGEIRFRFPAGYAPDQLAMNDAMFPIGLMLAMATGKRLALNFPVAERLVRSGTLANEIYASWLPKKLFPIAIDVPARPDSPAAWGASVRGISAFTGGVDSFATALRKKENIESHFYVLGYDIPLDTEFNSLRKNVQSNLQQAADLMQKRIIFVTTTVRRYLDAHTNWAVMSHGPAIAAVAHLISSTHNTLYIPSSYTYNDLHPWGSHPLTDPLWSSDRMSVFHDGAHLSRVEKTIQIAGEPAVPNHLRVCLSKRTDYNCGKCLKCLRTMLGLEIAGGLKDSRVFPNTLDLDVIRELELTSRGQLIFMNQVVEHALKYDREDISDAVNVAISGYTGPSL